jgi:tryptophan synthase alpha chain
MSRIADTFRRLAPRKALIAFVTAGDPNLKTTLSIMHALVASGVDVIELGVPFSDPMADGPVIQRASERALSRGVSLRDCLDVAHAFRKKDATTPVVLMGYANSIEAMGYETFAQKALRCGVDGVLVVDYPPQEAQDWARMLGRHGLDPIFLLSPTTTDARMQAIIQMARGFIYYVSLRGITGAKHLDLREVAKKIALIHSRTGLPVGVGFGIRDAVTAKTIAGFADAIVIGSRIVEEIEKSTGPRLLGNISKLAKGMRRAIDQAAAKNVTLLKKTRTGTERVAARQTGGKT